MIFATLKHDRQLKSTPSEDNNINTIEQIMQLKHTTTSDIQNPLKQEPCQILYTMCLW